MIRPIKLTRKWGVFLAINFLVLLVFSILFLRHFPGISDRKGETLMFSSVLSIQLASVIFSCGVNIYTFNKYYPDQWPGKWLTRLFVVCLVFDIASVITSIGVIRAVVEDTPLYRDGNNTRLIIQLLLLVLFAGVMIYTNVVRFQLKKHIQNAYTIKKMTESIGKENV